MGFSLFEKIAFLFMNQIVFATTSDKILELNIGIK